MQHALAHTNTRSSSGAVVAGSRVASIETGHWLTSLDGVRSVVVGTTAGTPVLLSDVARVSDGGGEPDDYVTHTREPARRSLR